MRKLNWGAKIRRWIEMKNKPKNISEHISYKEATQSQTATRKGIDNTPTEEELKAMKNVAEKCFEPVRVWYGKPIAISSFFRCIALNRAVGGSDSSDHVNGFSIDMDTENDNRKIFEWCIDNLKFDQLIWEFGGAWVHISFRMNVSRNRNMVLDARTINVGTKDEKTEYIDITKK